MTQEEFIKRAKVYHPELDYSKVSYQTTLIPVEIVCPIHGSFMRRPQQIISMGHNGCPECDKIRNPKNGESFRKTPQQAFNDIKKQFPNLNFSKAKYINTNTPIDVVCPIHGEFSIKPCKMRLTKYGCPDCGNANKGAGNRRLKNQKPKSAEYKDLTKYKDSRKKTIIFKMQAQVYFPEYNYSRVIYTGSKNRVEIICPKHGVFFQKPECLFHGHGCPKCGWESGREKRKHKEVKNV